MRKRKRTLRNMPPITKEICKIANLLHSANRKLMNITDKTFGIELDAQALKKFMEKYEQKEKE